MSFVRHASYLTLTRIFTSGLGFAIVMLSARILTPGELGSFMATVAGVALLTRLFSFGLGQSAQYFGAQEAVQKEDYGASLLVAALLLASISFVILMIFTPQIGQLSFAGNSTAQEVFAVLKYGIPAGIIHLLASLYVLGKRKILLYFWLAILPLISSFIVLFWGLFTSQGLKIVITAWIVQYSISAIIGVLVFFSFDRFRLKGIGQSLRLLFNYGKKAFVVSTSAYAVSSIVLLTGIWFSINEEVGFYTIGQTFAGALLLVYGAIGPMVFSYVGSMDKDAEYKNFIAQVCRISFIVFAVTTIAIAAIAPLVIPVLFGAQYTEVYLIVWILLPGLIFSATQRILENYLYGRSLHGSMVYIHGLTILIMVATSALLAPKLGAVGLALAKSVGFFCSFVFTLWLVSHRGGINKVVDILPRPSDIRLIFDKLQSMARHLWKKN